MNILICDDCREDLEDLSDLCRQYLQENGSGGTVTATENPLELELKNIDILLLDVEMPRINGLEIKEKLEIENERTLIIFVTNYTEVMNQAFGKNVIGFLTKPAKAENLFQLLHRGENLISNDRKVLLGDRELVRSSKIMYFLVENGYTYAVLENGEKSFGIFKALSKWEEELSDIGFIRVDKNHLVNCVYIKSIKDGYVILKNESEIKLSRRKKTECQKYYLMYLERNAKYI